MRRAAAAALLIILPLTLGLRSTRPIAPAEQFIDDEKLARDASASLAEEGWSVRLWRHHLLGPIISGSRRGCRILVNFPAPSAEDVEKFRIVAAPVGPVTYHYRNQATPELPRILPVLSWHLQRYAWGFGIALPTTPLIAVAQSRTCGSAVTPDFSELRQRLKGG